MQASVPPPIRASEGHHFKCKIQTATARSPGSSSPRMCLHFMAYCGKGYLTRTTFENEQIFKPDKQLDWGKIHRFCSCDRLFQRVLKQGANKAQMGVPAIVQKSTLGPTFKSFDMNTQREGSDRILEGKQAVVRQFHGCCFSHLSCSQPLLPSFPILAGGQWRDVAAKWPNRASRHKQLTQKGKRAVPEDSFCQTAGIYVGGGWYEEETEGWSGGGGGVG